jgi:hypothetical protein
MFQEYNKIMMPAEFGFYPTEGENFGSDYCYTRFVHIV